MQSLLHHLKHIPLIYGLIALPSSAFGGNFSQTCSNLTLNGSTLYANCKDGYGNSTTSSLDLNRSITNQFGNFQWQQNGGFAQTARDCSMNSVGILRCAIADAQGGWPTRSIDLNAHIDNNHGTLVSDIGRSAANTLPRLVTRDTHIIDAERGTTVTLRGVNLGGLFVTEMWMTPMVTSNQQQTQPKDNYTLIKKLDERFGITSEQALLKAYQQTWITENDLQIIKNRGFNAVRVPIWYGQFYPVDHVSNATFRWDAFDDLDRIVNAATSVGLYVILDMHGVVGGQSCSDSTGHMGPDGNEDGTGHPCSGTNDTNRFWSNASDQGNTQWMWWQIANHYKGNSTIAGYDLINEPRGAHDKVQVWNAYNDLYNTVRSVDRDHIVIMEGAFGGYGQWNWDELPDPATYHWTNVVYEMHEYQWSRKANDVRNGATRQVDDFKRHQSWNVPGYIGEFNTMTGDPAEWADSVHKYDEAGLSWTMWTYKSSNGTVPNGWGWYDTNGKGWMPNVNTDCPYWIRKDWEMWTTPNAFTENPNFQF